MLDDARDRLIPSQTGKGHLEVILDSFSSENGFLLMPWRLGLDHDADFNETQLLSLKYYDKQQQHDNQRLTLLED